MLALELLTALIIKHFMADFLLQSPYLYQNKHILGHLGGIIHAFIHAFLTWLVLGSLLTFSEAILIVAAVEFLIHYFVDWGKQNFNIKYNLMPDSRYFWWTLGFDQLLHYLTYVGIVYILIQI